MEHRKELFLGHELLLSDIKNPEIVHFKLNISALMTGEQSLRGRNKGNNAERTIW